MRRTIALVGVVLVLLAGCRWPQDVGTTLEDVRGGVLRVGVTEAPPWTRVTDAGAVTGAEARLVERLAQRLDARVEWYPGSESSLMAALNGRVLDLVVGGLDAKAPWTKEASLTRPYVTMQTIVAVPAGVPAPQELAGARVAVPAGTAEVAALRGEEAVPVPVAEVTGREGLPVVVGQWRLAELGLRATGHELAIHDHVWAVPPGENAWQVEVERFLLALSHGEVEGLLAAAEREEASA
ncbi:substrate-binding periplasmic protein [Micromonospora thermarum]|uniref:Transporter substrate-binding domain-containing protein n=1 Tax=Micromonospora thermarum TaxID=2720024 RepID=A0ABX0Z4R5_9ACTN|nr:transporter substrate-binding domain-containing protein [Micromonospora thermarum]NJP31058.1 transporter substrate-binding domain-containing protein [Micromonospora thermarum]